MGDTKLVDDKNIQILRRLSGLCGLSVPFTLNAILVVKYFHLQDYVSFGQVAYFGSTGFVIYIFLTVIAYVDCKQRDSSTLDKDFCKGVLLNCNYQFSGTPSYFDRVQRELYSKEITYVDKLVGRHVGNILYHILTFQALAFIGVIALSVPAAGLSLLFTQLLEVPTILLKLAILLIMPLPFVLYAFCSRMLYEFTQHSLDAGELKYYFSTHRLLFGALKYYDDTRAANEIGDQGIYRKIIHAPIRLS